MSTDTRHALAALLPCPFCGNSKGLAVANENPQDLSGGYFIACPSCDASTGLRFACGEDPIPLLIEQWNRRAALSAQPVAGAVAQQDQQADALRFRWLCEHPDWHFIERLCREFVADSRMEFLAELRRVIDARRSVELGPFEEHVAPQPQAAPAPQPSAQAVAHPSHQTVREWMPVSEALRLSDLWTAGDLDNCGQWRAAIKVLADEVRALAASPQPEPSAQGEPVAWVEPACHGNGGCCPDDKCEKWTPLASAPSTPPPAVGEAVPLAEAAERIEKIERAAMIVAGMLPSQDMAHAASRLAKLTSDFRWWWQRVGIAPKAAQPNAELSRAARRADSA